jgi:hypothetical protein
MWLEDGPAIGMPIVRLYSHFNDFFWYLRFVLWPDFYLNVIFSTFLVSHTRGHGIPHTAIPQAKQLINYLEMYSKQSAVFRELLLTISKDCISEPIVLYLGR